jgi:hypothetical protein
MTNEDVFEGTAPVEGLESLGRAIVDAQGAPSGSPANFEHTRGKSGFDQITAADKEKIVADLQAEFGITPD